MYNDLNGYQDKTVYNRTTNLFFPHRSIHFLLYSALPGENFQKMS